MSVGGWLAVATFAGLAVLATRNLPAIWRDSTRATERWPAWWVRGLPTAVAFGWAMLAGIPLAVLAPEAHGTAKRIILILVLLVVALIVLVGVVWVSAAVFGRPRFVVPPSFRPPRNGGGRFDRRRSSAREGGH